MSKEFRLVAVTLIFSMLLFSLVSAGALAHARSDPADAARALPAQTGADDSQILTGGVGYIMTGAYAFHPYYATNSRAFTGSFLYNPMDSTVTYTAAISLPHGATMTKMVFFFYDQNASDMTVLLTRCALSTGNCYTLAEVKTSGSDTTYRSYSDSTISSATVDNMGNTYHFSVAIPGGLGSALRLCGVRIDYEYDTSYFPVILN